MLIVFPIDLIKLNLLSVHVECVGQAKRYFQVYKTTEHVFAIICLVPKKIPKKCYSSHHIESCDTCMEH